MKRIASICAITILAVLVVAIGAARADEHNPPIPITADQAFDAVADQVDPLTGEPETKVILVDLRSVAEFNWVGTCAQVDKIVTKRGAEIIPDRGKVVLWLGGRLFQFSVGGHPRFLPVRRVDAVETSLLREDIGGVVNIPYETWDDDMCNMTPNNNFKEEIEALAYPEKEVVIITMCRSGGRTSACVEGFDTGLFKEVYEIDNPDKGGLGGFQGSSYHDRYNGYRGFPQRSTSFQDFESVSWCDAGLPITIGTCP